MYKLYIANKNYSSWSLRPWVLMVELGIPFDEQLVPFVEGSNWEAFRRFCPSGKVPCLQDGDTIIWDSLAIIEYLAERHAGVWPLDGQARAWSRCAAAEMHSGFSALRGNCPMNCGLRFRLREISELLQRDITRIDELWCEGISRFGGPFLAGKSFSAIDAFFAPVAFRIQTYGLQLSDQSANYSKRLIGLRSIQSWETMALKEPWRESGHEREMLKLGEILEDRRKS